MSELGLAAACGLVTAAAAVGTPPAPGPGSAPDLADGDYMNSSELAVARAIHRVVPQDLSRGDSFALLGERRGFANSPPMTPGRYVFQSAELKAEVVDCEEGAVVRIVNRGSFQSGFSISRCQAAREKLEAIGKAAPAMVAAVRPKIAGSYGAKEADLAKMGFFHARKSFPEGEVHLVPVVMGGHGFTVYSNAILVDKEAAWVVQAHLQRYCEDSGSRVGPGKRLCTQSDDVLAEIARAARVALPAK